MLVVRTRGEVRGACVELRTAKFDRSFRVVSRREFIEFWGIFSFSFSFSFFKERERWINKVDEDYSKRSVICFKNSN